MSTERCERAERAGYRVGQSIGRLMRPRITPKVPAIVASPISAAASGNRPFRVKPEYAFALFGLGVDLPFARAFVKSIIGALGAELLLSGCYAVSLFTGGSLSDPLQLGSALVSLASPLIQIALQPVLGPALAELALALIGVGLIVLVKSRNRPSVPAGAITVHPTILPQRSSSGTQIRFRSPV